MFVKRALKQKLTIIHVIICVSAFLVMSDRPLVTCEHLEIPNLLINNLGLSSVIKFKQLSQLIDIQVVSRFICNQVCS